MTDKEKFYKKKSLGQHFLTSDVVPRWMCDAAQIEKGDTVLEIGPGSGVLTKELLVRGAKVIAIEADQRAIILLQELFQDELTSGQFVLHHQDVRELDLHTLNLKSHRYKVVANIPYYLSGMLFRTFLECNIQPSLLVFLVQKEVAYRITRDKKESLLSLSVKAFGEPTYVQTVSKGHFSPPPKIDSAIVVVNHINQNNFKTIAPAVFFEILHLGLGKKRKQLLGNLTQKFNREQLTHIFSTLSIPIDIRGEDVPLEKWLALVERLSSTLDTQFINNLG